MPRGNGGQPLLTRPGDWSELTKIIGDVKLTSDFRLYAYCLMSNHVHLLLRVGAVPLSKVMQRPKTRWSKRFNIERRRQGHVFQGRFLARDCDDDTYFKWLLRYIHLDPVKARLAMRPEDWPWSSYRAYVGMDDAGLTDTAWP